ncbi:hypothetical protein CH92_16780 [Stutzerimonas stutzeri]|uniref:Zinc finger/thioredoxin putative domain-containing protein n=1 Tax=Stutzerimonas stutzeri TaxID=316 RepID=W8R196_STUST|nr:DUF3426 domain-containing protein [Stutzerimonas stutzeri]AHL76655.1 hypothetical protein CH92_16780 [Stutzerimonas stutzeri]MCQ4331187.1 DUF3426 domain-containing protein [Stutzerimonas stutzeri]
MTSFVTQCPHCRTSFRVTRAQLAAARGVVRCGACVELFNAARHLQGNDTANELDADSAMVDRQQVQAHTPLARSTADESTLWIHDDLDLDSLDLDEELAKLERQELELSREFLELQPQSSEGLQPHLEDQSTADDEVWTEQLLRAETDTPAMKHRTQAEPPSIAKPSPSAVDLQFTPVSDERPALPSPLAVPRGPLSTQLDSQERVEPVLDSLIEPNEEPPRPALAKRTGAENEYEPGHSGRQEREDPLFELDDEPLQLDWEARQRPWGRWLGWGLLNLIALLALASQYVAYNFDEIARQNEYRPWLERLCPALGCELPPRVDISQIKSSNLVVRSHPDFSGALVVDAIIYNRAAFAQPFPLLEVRFADIQGQTLAQRTFKPGEYLSGELAGQREMPSQIPIHIALDILDPGTKAVNYSLSFRSPD